MAPRQRRLHDLGPDLLGRIVALMDQRSRASAGATCRALWRASCLPEVWSDMEFCSLDLADQAKTPSALLFLERIGAGVQRFSLTTTGAAKGLALSRERLARLLGSLPALEGLCLDCHDVAVTRLSDHAARLPQLSRLVLEDYGQGDDLPEGHLTGLQRFSRLQDLELRLMCARLQEVSVGSLLRGIEALTELTRLLLMNLSAHSPVIPSFPTEGAWSPQVSRLQKLHEYGEDGLCLKLSLEFACLPALRVLDIDCFTWQQNGGVLCALQGLTSLSLGIYNREEIVTDPAGLKRVLMSLETLYMHGPERWLEGLSCLHLGCLTCLELQDSVGFFFNCLTWSSGCRLQCLVYKRSDTGGEVTDFSAAAINLGRLSPLTTLTSLTVYGCGGTGWPTAPCLAHLKELDLSDTGLTCIPGELAGAERLQLLEISFEPGLVVGRECAATLSRLSGGELKRVKVRHCPLWQSKALAWDEQSKASLRHVCRTINSWDTADEGALPCW